MTWMNEMKLWKASASSITKPILADWPKIIGTSKYFDVYSGNENATEERQVGQRAEKYKSKVIILFLYVYLRKVSAYVYTFTNNNKKFNPLNRLPVSAGNDKRCRR